MSAPYEGCVLCNRFVDPLLAAQRGRKKTMATKKTAPVKKLSPKQTDLMITLKAGPAALDNVDMRTANALFDAGFVKLTAKEAKLTAAGTKRALALQTTTA